MNNMYLFVPLKVQRIRNMLLLWVTILFDVYTCTSTQNVTRGAVPLINVDDTLVFGRIGTEVVEAAVTTIDTTCVFPSDKLLMRRYATAITEDGLNSTNTTGIWKMTDGMLNATKRLAYYTRLQSAIFEEFDIDWQEVTSGDLGKPLYSALAFKLYLLSLPECSLPRVSADQEAFVKEEIPSSYGSNVTKFSSDYTCLSTQSDVVIILDGSDNVGEENFETEKAFVKNFVEILSLGLKETRVGVVQFSSSGASIEISLNRFTQATQMVVGVDKIPYHGGSSNNSGNLADALRTTIDMFSVQYGARENYTGVSRVAIVLTQSNLTDIDGTHQAVLSLEQIGVSLFAVGIGPGVNETQLNMIGSSCGHVTRLMKYEELNDYLPEIQQRVCTQPASLNRSKPIIAKLKAGQRSYAAYRVNVTEGFKIAVSASFGELTVYLSTKNRNPNKASHHWLCRAAMNKRGLCFVPPDHLKNLTKIGEAFVTVYATFTSDFNEDLSYFVLFSGSIHIYPRLEFLVAMTIAAVLAAKASQDER